MHQNQAITPGKLEPRGFITTGYDKAAGDPVRAKALGAIYDRLVTAGGSYPQPMLIDQFANISRMLGQADQKPGRDAWSRYEDLVKELEAIKAAVPR